MNIKRISVLIILLLVSGCNETVEPVLPSGSNFIRFVEENDGSSKLEVAIASYKNPDGVRVDLISVVHFADKSFYQMLQTFFKAYEAVLYEMVAPKGAKMANPQGNFLSYFQKNLGEEMGMVSQMDSIDYTCDNFVRADLTPREVLQTFLEKNKGFWQAFRNSFFTSLTMQQCGVGENLTGDALLKAFKSKNKAAKLKHLFAKEMEAMEKAMMKIEEDGATTLIGERNRAAIEVLIKEKKKHDKLAIFYGAAHMADMEARLQRDLGFEKTGHVWFTAWDIEPVLEENNSIKDS